MLILMPVKRANTVPSRPAMKKGAMADNISMNKTSPDPDYFRWMPCLQSGHSSGLYVGTVK